MSSRYVRKWIIAAPVMGFLATGCGSSDTTFEGLGGSSGGGGTSAGTAGSDQGGAGGSSAGAASGGTGGSAGTSTGTGGSGGSSGSSAGGTSSGGSGGSSGTPTFDYEPVGVGDPWFFSSASDLDAFAIDLTGATGTPVWNEAGEMRVPLTFTASGDQALIHFTAPWDSVASALSPMDLTHRVLRARVKLAGGATAPGGVMGYSQSTSGWTWVNGDWNSFADLGSWHDIEFDFDGATAPGEVMRFGLQVYATGAGSAELIVDDLRLEPKAVEPAPDGGAPEADGGSEPPPVDADAGAPAEDAGNADADGGAGLGYTPVGVGDPWFFDSEAEMSAFTFTGNDGGSESHAWSSGEVHLTGTFSASAQTVALQFNTPWNGSVNTADLSGRVIRARVRIAAGGTATGGIQVFAQSNGWVWAAGDWNDASTLGSFVDVEFPMTSATDASNVQQLGIQFYATNPGTIEIIVDDLRLEPAN